MTDLSIIIVNWNTRELLAQCIQSIQDHVGEIKTQILVVDNASMDGSPDMVRREFPQVELINNSQNVGFASANNQAIRRSRGQFILLLNSDAQLVAGAAKNMLRYMNEDPKIGITGVCLKSADGSPQFCYGSFPNLWRDFRSLFGMHRWDLSSWGAVTGPQDVDWVSGACLMARRAMLDEIGLLDENFFMFGEEVDLCYRAKQAGWRVCLVPSDPVLHFRAGSTGKTPERITRLYNGKIRYCQKHLGQLQMSLLKIMIRLSTLGKLALFGGLSTINCRYQQRKQLWLDTWRLLDTGGV
jgi:GT2 family glycosyltransferase